MLAYTFTIELNIKIARVTGCFVEERAALAPSSSSNAAARFISGVTEECKSNEVGTAAPTTEHYKSLPHYH
jgi:hypothetical protein